MPRLELEDILALHEDLVRSYGGTPGILDLNRLLAALERPWAGFGGVELYPTPAEKAAAYLAGIAKGHPFLDGNKRTAFAAAEVFLRIEGYRLRLNNEEAFDLVLEVAQCRLEVEEVAQVLAEHLEAP
ncbi:type II toxin-antitoxin system death-on-curing family toxin [Meiothermus rufus]|uniref:type II toxin-antitoxin system death-on-curing family toxin n=1 Tax=Meiothermus rufus TaxID=604332 RepID=UPI00041F85F2|nr:type II toxin-antitoxin system death-on-curing family toxin [Meiothermus rufus]